MILPQTDASGAELLSERVREADRVAAGAAGGREGLSARLRRASAWRPHRSGSDRMDLIAAADAASTQPSEAARTGSSAPKWP